MPNETLTNDLGRVVPLHKGEYSAEAEYELNDIVSYRGSLYWHKSAEKTIGSDPTQTEVWALVVDNKGFDHSNGLYTEGGVDKHSAGSLVYKGVTTEEDSGWTEPVANGRGSINLGRGGVAGGQEHYVDASVSLDDKNHDYAFNTGKDNHNYGDCGVTMGRKVTNRGANGVALNNETENNADNSITTGKKTKTHKNAKNSFAGGEKTEVKKQCGFGHGYEVDIDAEFASGFGYRTGVKRKCGHATGAYNVLYEAPKEEQGIVPQEYLSDSSWYTESGSQEFTLCTPEQVLGFFQLLAVGVTFNGKTIKLGADIDLNPGWDGNLTVSGTTATFPTTPPTSIYTGDKLYNNSSDGRWFHGTFDGQGHVIRGIYSSYTYNSNGCLGTNAAGIFGNLGRSGYGYGHIQNLVIANSYLEYRGANQNGLQMSGVCSCLRGEASVENCYFNINLAARGLGNKGAYIGAIASYGGADNNGTARISRVVWDGVIADLNGTDTGTIKRDTSNGRIGLIYQNASGVSTNVAYVLNVGRVYCNLSAEADSGNGKSISGHQSQNVCVSDLQGGTFYGTFANTEKMSGWHYVDALGSYIPDGIKLCEERFPMYQVGDGSSVKRHDNLFVGQVGIRGLNIRNEAISIGDTFISEPTLRRLLDAVL